MEESPETSKHPEEPILPPSPPTPPRPPELGTWPEPLPAYPTIGIDPNAMFMFAGIMVATVAVVLLLWHVRTIIVILFFGIILAESLRPAVRWQVRHRLPAPLAVAIPYLAIVGVIAGVASLVVPIFSAEVVALGNQVPAFVDWLQQQSIFLLQLAGDPQLVSSLQQAAGQLSSQLVGITGFLVRLPLTLADLVITVTAVIVISIYWLGLAPSTMDQLFSAIPVAHREKTWQVLEEMGTRVGGYVRGTFALAIAIGVLVYPGLVALDVKFPLILAVFAGACEIIPFVGPVLGAIPSVALALFDSPAKAGLVIVLFVVVQQIENNLLAPNIMGRAVGVAPLIVILSLLAGSALGGIVGAIVAIPAAAVAQVAITDVILPVLADRARRPRPSVEDRGGHIG